MGLSHCDRLLAWHRHGLMMMLRPGWCKQFVMMTVNEELAFKAGEAAGQGHTALWSAIRHVLPRWRNKQRANLRCVGPSISDQFDHYDSLEAGHLVDYGTLLRDCHEDRSLSEVPVSFALRDLPSSLDIIWAASCTLKKRLALMRCHKTYCNRPAPTFLHGYINFS